MENNIKDKIMSGNFDLIKKLLSCERDVLRTSEVKLSATLFASN